VKTGGAKPWVYSVKTPWSPGCRSLFIY